MSSASLAPHAAEIPPSSFTVPSDRLFQDWKAAYDRCSAYLVALDIPRADHDGLARLAIERALQERDWSDGQGAVAATMRALRQLVPDYYPLVPKAWHAALPAMLAWRLEVWLSGRLPAITSNKGTTPLPEGKVASTPRLARRSMVPEKIERRVSRRVLNRLLGKTPPPQPGEVMRGRALFHQRHQLPWIGAARRRRVLLIFLVLIPSIVASGFMQSVLPHQGRDWLELVIVLFFGALFGWISIGFWTAMLGFFTLAVRRDRFTITNLPAVDWRTFEPAGRTAIVMPICHEPVDRVFAGLRAIHDSLVRTGALAHFDFFVLSDSADPSTCLKEEEAWAAWCRDVTGFDHIFYRRRKVRQKRKSGNVADFCRRWGSHYPYMIMLDADSIMAGETLVRLVQMMDKHPTVGMIQTAPTAVNRSSLLARVQQFASHVYGPMFAAGLHFWQLGDGQYWGHNAIIRTKPFIDHCGLPRLPGKPPLGGEIMSHDFVEAALMGRSGWNLWLAFDLQGSYEEVPSTLLEEMGRDRRWCQGNLQHLRLLFTEGLFGAHRALFINGVLSYVSALLWNAFLGLSTIEAIRDVFWEPEYFPNGPSLFPQWPVWRPYWALSLMAVTGMILFLPKFLSVALIVVKRNARAYGGLVKLLLSVLLEILLSSLLAPIRMVFHSRFVMQNLLGRTVQWTSQGRDDSETTWRAAIWHHLMDTVVASGWAIGLYWLNPMYFWWVTPIIVALVLSIPTSVYSSRTSLGLWARDRGLFLIPEETARPRELLDLDRYQEEAERQAALLHPAERDGFVRGIVDPFVNALHRALLGRRRSLKASIRAARRTLLERALATGPNALDARQRRILLSDPELVDELHERVWSLADEPQAAQWGRPGATHR